MGKVKENIECYANPTQREVLTGILNNDLIRNNFFLTGGTALSVFYLHHRTSVDLDFFTVKKMPLDDIYLWITKFWPGESTKINQGEFILQTLIKDIKVDIVYDPLSFDESREKYYFGEENFIMIDSLRNMASNKLSAVVGRREVKDFVDFFFINKIVKGMELDSIYKDAQKKEGMFDDPPTVAYQLELHFEFIKENPDIFPETRIDLDMNEFYAFYEDLIREIYHRKQ